LAEQEKLFGEMHQMREIYKKCIPDIAFAYDELSVGVYKDGVLSGKIKRMMALAGALVHGCRACILYQTEEALALGATAEEIL
jgi:AhpD family alkylhydroperoxidase